MNTKEARKLAVQLRKEAETLEALAMEVEQNHEALKEENNYVKNNLEPRQGIVAPWDLMRFGEAGGYHTGNGTDGTPTREVRGQGWETLCVCPNVESAKFVAFALNEFLKTAWPKLMKENKGVFHRHKNPKFDKRQIQRILSNWKTEISKKLSAR